MSQRQCPNCGYTANPENATHCAGCGRALASSIPATLPLPRRRPSALVWAAAGIAGVILVFTVTCLIGVLASGDPASLRLPFTRDRQETPVTVESQMAEIRSKTTDQVPKTAAAALTPVQADTPAPEATHTQTPTVTPTHTPTHTPTPSPTPCGITVYTAFRPAWDAHREALACPTAAARQGVWMAEEQFQSGRMFWREDNDKIYVLYGSGRWARYDDVWKETDPAYSCGTESNPPTPIRGFGKIWCTYDEVRQGLGDATTIESGQHGTVQDFTGGSLLRTGSGVTYALLNDGTWQQH